MGKNKKEFPKRKQGKESSKNSLKEQEMKNIEDTKLEYTKTFEKLIINSKLFSLNNKYMKLDEKFNNKFDMQYPEIDYQQIDLTSRKESRDSTSDSISYEDYYENDINSININHNNNNYSNNKNKFSLQNKQKNKKQGPFKSTATDFKIKYKTELCKYYEING